MVTREVAKRLQTFLDAYNEGKSGNGVWISGFFGSGKSHLLKMLALLLENRETGGRTPLSFFEEKFREDLFLIEALRKAARIPSRSVLFNIDQQANAVAKDQADALLSVFVRVFDDMQGYYGQMPHVADFERHLDEDGHLPAFQTAFERITGKTWEIGRRSANMAGRAITDAFTEATGNPVPSGNILKEYREDRTLSIADFADRVSAYVARQEKAAPGFRLNFFVDEVGQYIADNVRLMTNLQTIAESLNTRCRGRAWIVVTAQQEMDTIIGEMNRSMPTDFLAADGWVARMREVMTEDACQDVEIIGWLYQFYISEKKDQVFAGLKRNQKITAENIPAATQLFTPHWIVRYLVENSLGRLWLLNRPGSRLAERMEYYIAPEEPETDFLGISGPQEIRICDPACGSGHMLTYAFDLLYAIYEEEGFPPAEIPGLILTHNLTGIEIDDRAGALAAFALAMKAAAKLGRRRFLRMEASPDVVVLENVTFTPAEMQDVAAVVGRDLFTDELRTTLMQFEQAKNFGSLIVPKLRDPVETLRVVEARDFGSDLLLKGVRDRVVAVLRMAEALAPRYHVVVANPPYMGASNSNNQLKAWLGKQYKDSKSDLFSAFLERALVLAKSKGYPSLVTMEAWMFLSSFEKLRGNLLNKSTITSLTHMPYLGKGGTSMGINFGTVACCFVKQSLPDLRGVYTCVRYFETDDLGVPFEFPVSNERLSHACTTEFLKIPGAPLAYWAPEKLFDVFAENDGLSSVLDPREGLTTGNNERHVRNLWEISRQNVGRGCADRKQAADTKCKWFPFNKGGEYRKWAGNDLFVVNWKDDGYELQNTLHPDGSRIWAHNFNLDYIFRPSVSWSDITTRGLTARLFEAGFIFDATGLSAFEKTDGNFRYLAAALCNSKVGSYLAPMLNPTMHFKSGDFAEIPFVESIRNTSAEIHAIEAAKVAKSDWDAYETSWDFTMLPLLSPDHQSGTLEATYARLRAHWAGMKEEMKRLEEENNRIFIDAYGLQDELTPEVPIEEITLTCNPAYRYGVKGTEEEREARLLADTMKELISYAIGCMFGRYSLDAPGLILANQGDTAQTYLDRIPNPTFAPDRDNVIPLFEEDWFADDAYQRFREFLSVTFGADRLVENLEFMRAALGKEVRAYLAKDFYADHVQRYKKRPIYWLVSSPKGAFQALIYMHRYTPDTLNITLNDYVRGLRDRLEAALRAAKATEISPDATPAEKNRAKRDIDRFTKQIAEVTEWERDTLYPLAVERIRIDLDDGVKRNYPKFPGVLRPIKGLEDEDA